MRPKKIKLVISLSAGVALLIYSAYKISACYNPNPHRDYGEKLDSLNGVYVFYNGNIHHTQGRHLTKDGYNLGLNYQCVEFAKRYYYLHYHHKMPDTYGHAKDFFEPGLAEGARNLKRNLLQYTNPGHMRPQAGDLLVFGGTLTNPYGHVAIVSYVSEKEIEVIQQNPGPFAQSRIKLRITKQGHLYSIADGRLFGWLRLR